MDDPLGHLDDDGVKMVLKLIESLKRSNKTIILFSDNKLISDISDNTISIGN